MLERAPHHISEEDQALCRDHCEEDLDEPDKLFAESQLIVGFLHRRSLLTHGQDATDDPGCQTFSGSL